MDLEKLSEKMLELAENSNLQDKMAEGLGMLFPYASIKKKAIDMYVEEIQKSDLSTDSKMIALLNAKNYIKKLKNQKEIVEIAADNAKEGTTFAEKSGVSEEWLDRYMEAASFVSSEKMQLVWGKILANEFENPGCTPPNMTRILCEFTPTYAKAFRTLCSMRVLLISVGKENRIIDKIWENVIAFEQNEEYMRKVGLSFELMNELESLGVIKFDALAGYEIANIKENTVLVYSNGKVIETNAHNAEGFPVGNVMFTSAGRALSEITESYELDGYDELVYKYLKYKRVSIAEENSYDVILDGDEVQVVKKNNDIGSE